MLTRITPLAPPYAVYSRGAGIFRDAERLDFQRVDASLSGRSIPSTKISGSGLPVKVAIPRIQNWASSLPGSPEVCNDHPARLPASVWLSDRTGTHSQAGSWNGPRPIRVSGTVAHGDDFDALHADGLGLSVIVTDPAPFDATCCAS